MITKKRTGSIEPRGRRSWRIRYYDALGVRQRETIKGEREDAARELAIRLGEIAKGIPVSSRPNTVLFEELAADVLTDYQVNKFKSEDDLDARLRLHILPAFGKMKAAQITTAQIKRYIVARQAEKRPAKPGTINRELEAIRHTFKLAIQGRKLFQMPHVPLLREDNVREGFFTRDEVDRLIQYLEEPLASVVLFAFLTGWRLGEIRMLEWRHVDFARGEIRLDAGSTKNRKGRVFPMTTELRRLLRERETAAEQARDSSRGAGSVKSKSVPAITSRVFPIGEFRKTWKTACYKAGIPCTVEPVRKGGIRGAVKVLACSRTFHDLRRSAAKHLVAQIIPERVVMQICGWETRSVFDRYSIVGEADLQIAKERMEGHTSTSNKTEEGKAVRTSGPK